jgi:hypothetical protein
LADLADELGEEEEGEQEDSVVEPSYLEVVAVESNCLVVVASYFVEGFAVAVESSCSAVEASLELQCLVEVDSIRDLYLSPSC